MLEERDANDKRNRREEKVRIAKEEPQQKCQKGMPRKRDVKTKRHPEEKIAKERDAE